MPVTTNYQPITYAGDGVANAFPVTFVYQYQTDLVVKTLVVATGTYTTLVLGTGYTVTPTLNSPASTGTVTLTTPPPSGTDVVISRNVPLTQETTWVPNDPNLSTSTMNAVDKLTMIVQQVEANPFSLTGDASTFLRGDNTLSNTLIASGGAPTVPADSQAVFNAENNGVAAIRVLSGATSVGAYRFGHGGGTNAWDMQWGYDPVTGKIGWYAYGGSALGTFDTSGNLSITGTYTGSADAALITSGVLNVARLGTGSGNANTFLNGTGSFSIPAGGGGINTTTTGTFVIAAVNSTQTVPVTDATGITVGTYLQISDGTHTIIGLVTVIASLNLTVQTTTIVLGTAGSTMASGAAVQAGLVGGSNSILFKDTSTSPTSVTTVNLLGNAASYSSGSQVPFAIVQNNGGGNYTIGGYVPVGGLAPTCIDATTTPIFSACVIAIPNGATDTHASKMLPSAQGQSIVCTSFSGGVPHNIAWGTIDSTGITAASLTPALLNCTNALTDTYVFGYDSASGHFKMFANTGLPAATNTGQFLRGDGAYSNILDLNASTGEAANRLMLTYGTTDGSFGSALGSSNTGTTAFWIMQKRAAGSWGTPAGVYCNYQIGTGIDRGVLSVGEAWSNPDGSNVESIDAYGMIRSSTAGLRDIYGPWHKIFAIDMTGVSAQTVDLVNGAYQRLSSFNTNCTITLDDTSPLPTALRYASEITLELVDPGTHVTAWAATGGTIVWANGASAPTLASTGKNIVKFVRSQDQTYWIGTFVQAVTGAGTVTSVASGSGLTGGPITTSGTLSIATGGVTGSMIASGAITNTNISASAAIAISKLATTGTPSSTTFLNGNGQWATPAGGGGGVTLAGNNAWSGTNSWSNTSTFTGATTFNTSANFNLPTWSGDLGSSSFVGTQYLDGSSSERIPLAVRIYDSSAGANIYDPISSLYVTTANRTSSSGGVKFWTDARGTVSTAFEFTIATTSVMQSANVAANDIRDGIWLNSWSPNSVFASTAATYTDGGSTTHSFANGGIIRVGECNYGNAWGDIGFIARRGISSYVSGLEFFPDWLPGTVADYYGGSPPTLTKYNAQWALAIGAAAPGTAGGTPKNWIGLLIDQDGIVGKNDYSTFVFSGSASAAQGGGGYGIQLHGSSSSANPIGKGINLLDAMDIAIDISSATITQEATSGHLNRQAIMLASGQAICFKAPTGANTGVYIWFNGTNLVASKDGGNTTATIV